MSRSSHLEDHRTVLDVERKIFQVESTVIFGIEPETFHSLVKLMLFAVQSLKLIFRDIAFEIDIN